MDNTKHIKLSQLANSIARAISLSFGNSTYWVLAEITNLKFYPEKGYYFLDLIEKEEFTNKLITSMKANVWSNATNRINYFEDLTGQKFSNNIRVLLKVAVEYHILYGLKLNIVDIDPSFTIGKLEEERLKTLKLLVDRNPVEIFVKDGVYLTPNKTLTLNPVIQKIALISSLNSDGHNDFVHELENNPYHYTFSIDEYPAQVQGAGMERGIINRLDKIRKSGVNYDATVIVRGGGSQTDFHLFDSFELAEVVAKFPIPIFTGIGHTRNESIVDLMAFRPTKTPTKVAESIVVHNRSFEEKTIYYKELIVSKTAFLINTKKMQLTLLEITIQTRLKDILHKETLKLLTFKSAIDLVVKQILTSAAHQIATFQQLFTQLDPKNVLKRGYAMIYQDDHLITKANRIKLDELIIKMDQAEILTVVKTIIEKKDE